MIVLILLGIVQGLTEFLPVSSSGHLVIFQKLFGFEIQCPLFFDTMLHVGTLLSVVVIFWQDVRSMVKEFIALVFRDKGDPAQRRMLLMIMVATLPMLFVVPFRGYLDMLFGNVLLVSIALIITGTFLFVAEKFAKGQLDQTTGKYKHALLVGMAQAVAILPGISRSGATISAARVIGFKREFAVKISFLMSIITILGAVVVQVPDILTSSSIRSEFGASLIGMMVAAISGVLSIKLLVKIINRGKFFVFAYYCWIVGLLSLIWSVL